MSDKGAYVYSLNLKGGKKYVGFTRNINKRLNQHFSGNGAKVTKANKPLSVNHIQKCKNVRNAKKAETIVYHKMKKYHGANRVRGAGNTKPFKKSYNAKSSKCYRCGRTSHYSNNCYASSHVKGYYLDE